MKRFKRWFYGMVFDLKNGDQDHRDDDICCCGDYIEDHNYYSGHTPVDLYDYTREQYIQSKMH